MNLSALYVKVYFTFNPLQGIVHALGVVADVLGDLLIGKAFKVQACLLYTSDAADE